jgi:AcrR family transcriptional regulator
MARIEKQRHGQSGRATTRIALIEAAESLFARPGVDVVTTRELQEAAGSANKNVVGYYFADRAALLAAIYRHREPKMEARRAELLDELDTAGHSEDLCLLLDALHRPYLEQTDANGQHSYCRLLATLHAGWAWTHYKVSEDLQVTRTIVERIRQLLQTTTEEQFIRRITMTFSLIANALRVGDDPTNDAPSKVPQLYSDAIYVGVAVLKTDFAAVRKGDTASTTALCPTERH